MTRATTRDVAVPLDFYQRLEHLALRHERSVADLLQHAVEMQYGDDAASARLRLMDRLARLEARLGDPETLHDEIARDARAARLGR